MVTSQGRSSLALRLGMMEARAMVMAQTLCGHVSYVNPNWGGKKGLLTLRRHQRAQSTKSSAAP